MKPFVILALLALALVVVPGIAVLVFLSNLKIPTTEEYMKEGRDYDRGVRASLQYVILEQLGIPVSPSYDPETNSNNLGSNCLIPETTGLGACTAKLPDIDWRSDQCLPVVVVQHRPRPNLTLSETFIVLDDARRDDLESRLQSVLPMTEAELRDSPANVLKWSKLLTTVTSSNVARCEGYDLVTITADESHGRYYF
jgi:hypothetical protein